MDGIYKINLNTQMGNIDGLINIVTKENDLTGYLEVMGNKTEFAGGKVQGNNLYINGKAKAGFITIKYDIQGEIRGNDLLIKAKTNMGSFETIGKKVG